MPSQALGLAGGAHWVDELSRNFVYAVRSMRKNPGFTGDGPSVTLSR